MDFSTLTDTLLSATTTLGPVVVALTVLLGTVGLPMPSTALVVATGALVREGTVDLAAVLLLGLAAAIAGDGAGYLLGRRMGDRAAQRFPGTLWEQASERFARQGWGAIYLSRWLLTPVSVPINVISGVANYAPHRFLSAEIAGDLTWLALYAGAGYLLGSQWQRASDLVGNNSGLVLMVTTGLLLLWWVVRRIAAKTRASGLAHA